MVNLSSVRQCSNGFRTKTYGFSGTAKLKAIAVERRFMIDLAAFSRATRSIAASLNANSFSQREIPTPSECLLLAESSRRLTVNMHGDEEAVWLKLR